MSNAPHRKPDAYALRYPDGSYWVGIWGGRNVAEDVRDRMQGKPGGKVEVVPLYLSPPDAKAQRAVELLRLVQQDAQEIELDDIRQYGVPGDLIDQINTFLDEDLLDVPAFLRRGKD